MEYPNEIWSLFKKRTQFVPQEIEFGCTEKKFQLFEVVFTKLISLINPNAEWKVTPIQGDEGVDFFGSQQIFDINDIEMSASIKIGGQCKRRNKPADPVDLLGGDIIKMVKSLHPVYVIIGLAAETSKEKIKSSTNMLNEAFNIPFFLFGIEEIDFLLRKHLPEITPILQNSLTNSEYEQIINHFGERETESLPSIDCHVNKENLGLAGIPFNISLNIKSIALIESDIKIRWIRPKFDDRKNIVIIKPNELLLEEGLTVKNNNSLSYSFNVKFVSYIVGSQNLGQLEISIGEHNISIYKLGTIELIDNYHPRFYWPPYQENFNKFKEVFNTVKTGKVEIITVTGEGGVGKTRLINELGIFGEQNGTEFITISQIHNYEKPYQLLADLYTELTFQSKKITENNYDLVLEKLNQVNQELASNVEDSLKLIFDNLDTESETLQFKKEYVIQSLLLLILIKSTRNELIFHFSDLHWTHHSILSIISDVIERLKQIQHKNKIPILFIFEGRIGEYSNFTHSIEEYKNYSTETFEKFVALNDSLNFLMKPFDEDQSKGFLDNLFENSQSGYRRIKKELIPHQTKLKTEILKYASGNPFHMIEQIKFLTQKGIVQRNENTGLIYLLQQISDEYNVPLEIEKLILSRFNYIQERSPSIANLIRSVALIQDRITNKLFQKLMLITTGTNCKRELSKTDILVLPLNNIADIKFRHENYYNVIKSIPFDAKEKDQTVKIYLDWIDSEDNESADTAFLKTLILSESSNPDHSLICNILEENWSIAKKQYLTILEQRILTHLLLHLEKSDNYLKLSSFDKIFQKAKWEQRIAQLFINSGNWGEASRQLEKTLSKLVDYNNTESESSICEETRFLKYSLIINLANSYNNQLKTHQAIKLLKDNLDEFKLNYSYEVHPDKKNNWLRLYLDALNRLGVALWHDGNYEDALDILRSGYNKIPDNSSFKIYYHIFLLDIGFVNLHFNFNEGLNELKKSYELIDKIETSPRNRLLSHCSMIIGKLYSSKELKDENKYHQMINDLERIYVESKRNNYRQEESAAASTLGIILALVNDRKCIKWFMDVIDICFKNNLIETLWKTHLNLAQFEYSQESYNKDAAIHHAKYAENIILTDLKNRSVEEQKFRIRHYTKPYQMLLKILKQTELSIYFQSEYLDSEAEILYLKDDKGNMYFLYGG